MLNENVESTSFNRVAKRFQHCCSDVRTKEKSQKYEHNNYWQISSRRIKLKSEQCYTKEQRSSLHFNWVSSTYFNFRTTSYSIIVSTDYRALLLSFHFGSFIVTLNQYHIIIKVLT